MSSGWFYAAGDSSANQVTHVAATLCFFDYFLTFDGEVTHIWKKRFSVPAVLFIVNRYAMLVASAANLAQSVPWDPGFVLSPEFYDSNLCEHLVRTADICILLVTLSYICFAALRMFALYGMNKLVFALVFAVGFVSPALQIYPMVVEYIVPDAPTMSPSVPLCLKQGDDDQFSVIFPSLIGIRVSTLALELVLLGLTWYKTLSRWRTLKTIAPTPLTTMLLRDGTIYFSVITILSAMNLCGMIYILYSSFNSRITDFNVTLFDMVPLVDTATSICMSRFIIGLRNVSSNNGDNNSVITSKATPGTLRFATAAETVVGSLGADLRLASDGDFGEGEDWEEQEDDEEADEHGRTVRGVDEGMRGTGYLGV